MSSMVKRGHLGGNIRTGDPNTFEPDVWKWLVARYGVRTGMDVGCGRGHAVAEFRRLGVNMLGVDGLAANAWKEGVPIIVHDYCAGPLTVSNLDLIWCCEFVEHVEERFMDNYLATFRGARILAMTYGVGRGYHHVNVQDEAYWVSHIQDAGFRLLRRGTAVARRKAVGPFVGRRGLLFERTWG